MRLWHSRRGDRVIALGGRARAYRGDRTVEVVMREESGRAAGSGSASFHKRQGSRPVVVSRQGARGFESLPVSLGDVRLGFGLLVHEGGVEKEELGKDRRAHLAGLQQPRQDPNLRPVADAMAGVAYQYAALGKGIPFPHVGDFVADQQIAVKHQHFRIGREDAQHVRLAGGIRIQGVRPFGVGPRKRRIHKKAGLDKDILVGRPAEHAENAPVRQPLLKQGHGKRGLVGQRVEAQPVPHLLLTEKLPDLVLDPGMGPEPLVFADHHPYRGGDRPGGPDGSRAAWQSTENGNRAKIEYPPAVPTPALLCGFVQIM